MATFEKYEKEVNDARDRLNKAEEKLEEFEKGWKEKRLWELEKKLEHREEKNEEQRKVWERQRDMLEEEKKELKADKVDKWKQATKLQNALLKFGEEKGENLRSHEKKRSYDGDVNAFVESKRRFFDDELPKHMRPSSYAHFETFADLQKKYEQPILCHRPPGASSTPVTLLHPIFGQFVDDCKDGRPASEDFQIILKLSYYMSMFYNSERERAEVFRELITDYCKLTFIACEIKNGYTTDGSLIAGKYYYANVEAKVELGSGGEPLFQTTIYYLNMVREHAMEYPGFVFPCLHIYFAGSTFGFSGSACPKKVHMDPLTPMFPLAWNPYEKDLRIMAARTFTAFKKAIHNLKMYYENEFPAQLSQTPQNPEFPYKWNYKDGDTTVYFKYMSQPIKEKLIFFAKNDMDKNICIKFVHQYSADAHNHCANKAYAPHLHSCEHIPGGWLMIVMDYIDRNAYSTYDPCSRSFPSVEEVKSKINDIVKHLHEGDWVHGDLRSANFLVRINGDNNLPLVMLIDFDWAGKEMMVQYPLDIDITGVRRPNEVKGGELITKKHDCDMLAIMWEELQD